MGGFYFSLFKPCYSSKKDSYKKDLVHDLLMLGIKFFKNGLQKGDQELGECGNGKRSL